MLCIDEATASVDKATDHLLQRAIREEFADSTVLTIAHRFFIVCYAMDWLQAMSCFCRLETIMDSDRILCMDQGKVIDFEAPDDLLADPNSLFSQLTSHSTT